MNLVDIFSKNNKHRTRHCLYITGLVLALLCLSAWFSTPAWGFNTDWDEDFETYEVGDLNGNGYWTGSVRIDVSTNSYYGSKGATGSAGATDYNFSFSPTQKIDSGVQVYQFAIRPQTFAYNSSTLRLNFRNNDDELVVAFTFGRISGENKMCIKINPTGACSSDGYYVGVGNWALITMTVDFNAEMFYLDATSIEGSMEQQSNSFDAYGLPADPLEITYVYFYNNDGFTYDLDYFQTPVSEASVFGSDPPSETEVNNLDDILTVGYSGLEAYDSLFITLKNKTTGIFSNAKEYLISEIGESGELEIPLTDFNIEKNGNWYLYANATYEGYQYEGGYFLSGYGYNWTDDLTNGEYYLFINIEGYEGFFEMSDFEEWYGDNAKFDTPTTMFSAIAGFFDPIFSKIGEFGFRITTYFDNNTAYSKGYEIGRAIPLFSYYLGQVGVFMGGFPLLNWLLIIILLLVGIFIFRVILKFIPFLGGS